MKTLLFACFSMVFPRFFHGFCRFFAATGCWSFDPAGLGATLAHGPQMARGRLALQRVEPGPSGWDEELYIDLNVFFLYF